MKTNKCILLTFCLFSTLITIESLPNLQVTQDTSNASMNGVNPNSLSRVTLALSEFLKQFSRGEGSPLLKALDTGLNMGVNFPGRRIYDILIAFVLTTLSLFLPFRLLQNLALIIAFIIDQTSQSGKSTDQLLNSLPFPLSIG